MKSGKVSVLVLCTGNSARSQMAEGYLKALDPRLDVESAGTAPVERVNPFAVRAMAEVGIDLASHAPKDVRQFLERPFDFVVTVCGGAEESCPAFTGRVGRRVHIGFPDPAEAEGSAEEVMEAFRRVRDDIRERFGAWYEAEVKHSPAD
jgi:arsenate reductase (thioredoxin)